MMNEHEQKIRDLRTLEAKRQDYMGLKGKFGAILKTMGEPIIRHTQGGQFYTENRLDDLWDLEEDAIPTSDTENRASPDGWEWGEPKDADIFGTVTEGWHFDGLQRGYPLEIWFKEDESELKVIYKGYVVYRELAGDLRSFVPNQEWQSAIEKLYSQSHKKLRHQQNENNKNKQIAKTRAKVAWLEKMKKLWGA